jgi:prephenate dehydrogenase
MAKLAIVGAGFTGASLALALRPTKLFDHIAGWDVDRSRLQAAKRAGAIDADCRSSADAVESAALVVVSVPSAELAGVFREMAPTLSPGAIVTETSLWKLPAQDAATGLPDGVCFVAGRPVLDGAGTGPEQATASALRGAVWCLTPGPLASAEAVNAVSAVVTAAGAQPYFLEAAEHDALTAAGELLPSILQATLPLALLADGSWPEAGKLAGDTLAAAARLAEDLPGSLWADAAANRASLSRWLETAASALLDLRDRLDSQDAARLEADWQSTLAGLARWRADKRQLRDSTMPSKEELKPNLFGGLSTRFLSHRGGTG